jgi:hypothetical protein
MRDFFFEDINHENPKDCALLNLTNDAHISKCDEVKHFKWNKAYC